MTLTALFRSDDFSAWFAQTPLERTLRDRWLAEARNDETFAEWCARMEAEP